MNTDTILGIDDAAEYLGVKKWTVYLLAKQGRIPAVKIGGKWRFRRDVLDAQFASAFLGLRVAETRQRAS